MGEYAIDKRTGQHMKIGTCEEMYYLRFEQRRDVIPLAGNVDPVKQAEELWFRLPRRDEAGIAAGDFEYKGAMGATPIRIYVPRTISEAGEEKPNPIYKAHMADLEAAASRRPGNIQLHHESGVHANVPCYHGAALPLPKGMFYNGHAPNQLGAFAVGIRGGVPVVLVGCRTCGKPLWYFEAAEFQERFRPWWNDVENFGYLLEKLEAYKQEMARA